MPIFIGITDTEAHYPNYPLWIERGDADIHIITLTPENPYDLAKCDGLVLSGGVDTHPRFYGSTLLSYPNAPEVFNEQRDEFELQVFRYACEKNVPLLAICRGMQLVNIALGGNMLQDLEASEKNNHRKIGAADGIHDVTITKPSLLYQIASTETGTVNSAHHQGLDLVAPDLLVNAWSPDGVVEGIEWKNKASKNFLLGVQWHPERLNDLQPGNRLCVGVREMFLQEVQKQHSNL